MRVLSGDCMFHRGVKFTVVATEAPELWLWQFTIDGKTWTGRTEARLELLAIRRVRLRIDRELKKARRRPEDRGR